jgi:hypothetical protein
MNGLAACEEACGNLGAIATTSNGSLPYFRPVIWFVILPEVVQYPACLPQFLVLKLYRMKECLLSHVFHLAVNEERSSQQHHPHKAMCQIGSILTSDHRTRSSHRDLGEPSKNELIIKIWSSRTLVSVKKARFTLRAVDISMNSSVTAAFQRSPLQ